ncbi:MAG TPA: formylmethanofuran dehydrogenase [Methanotrichaceae archaeon]|nr:formylmethanofuran dehydrogenase [Methanotrichaceae archaeon]
MAGAKEVTVVTYRGIFQEVEEALGMYSDGYRDQSAIVSLDGGDIKELGVEDGQPVILETGSGKVVVAAKLSEDPHPGLAFMPSSPWSAQLVSGEVEESGFLDLKSFMAKVSLSPAKEAVTSIEEIAERIKAP